LQKYHHVSAQLASVSWRVRHFIS